MLRALIIDDEIKYRRALHYLLKLHCPNIEVLGEADSVKTGITLLQQSEPDLLFLDIKMADGTGFHLLEQCEQINFQVVFVTAFNQFALKAFQFCAVDYLLKPVKANDLVRAVKKVSQRNANECNHKLDILLGKCLENKVKKIGLPTLQGIEFVDIDDIIRCVADGNYTKITLVDNRAILVAKKLRTYEEVLSNHHFFRAHRSYLINLKYISKYNKNGQIVMDDGYVLEIARRRRDSLLSIIAQLQPEIIISRL